MDIYFWLGNLFSLAAVICIGISVVKKDKTSLIKWQIVDVIFCILSNIALFSYSALTTNSVALIRNVLAYKNKLSVQVTYVLFFLCIVVGIYANNLGIIGWFPIAASSSYTIFMKICRTDQQMRYAVISNLALWFVHDIYIQAYPSAAADVILCLWSAVQVVRNMKKKEELFEEKIAA